MTARISARLDDETRARLERIQAATGKSVTQLITEALDIYDQKLRAESLAGNRELLSLAGLFEGPPSLSERVKDEFAEALDDKLTPHR
ncbi:MAG: ribbon-helix-helix domain-containing protein [Burkholderiaceae bacterium]|jgi:predicted transcriptional regulator|nr:ribbon-helix-helix domain-containing protein [Burkholderiaceae bacterium]MEB2317426.1 ribbon-helix-helix protein, CopG family [Pseudomonadota bacterium]